MVGLPCLYPHGCQFPTVKPFLLSLDTILVLFPWRLVANTGFGGGSLMCDVCCCDQPRGNDQVRDKIVTEWTGKVE